MANWKKWILLVGLVICLKITSGLPQFKVPVNSPDSVVPVKQPAPPPISPPISPTIPPLISPTIPPLISPTIPPEISPPIPPSVSKSAATTAVKESSKDINNVTSSMDKPISEADKNVPKPQEVKSKVSTQVKEVAPVIKTKTPPTPIPKVSLPVVISPNATSTTNSTVKSVVEDLSEMKGRSLGSGPFNIPAVSSTTSPLQNITSSTDSTTPSYRRGYRYRSWGRRRHRNRDDLNPLLEFFSGMLD